MPEDGDAELGEKDSQSPINLKSTRSVSEKKNSGEKLKTFTASFPSLNLKTVLLSPSGGSIITSFVVVVLNYGVCLSWWSSVPFCPQKSTQEKPWHPTPVV